MSYYAPDPPKSGWAWEASWENMSGRVVSAWRCPHMNQRVVFGVDPPPAPCTCVEVRR